MRANDNQSGVSARHDLEDLLSGKCHKLQELGKEDPLLAQDRRRHSGAPGRCMVNPRRRSLEFQGFASVRFLVLGWNSWVRRESPRKLDSEILSLRTLSWWTCRTHRCALRLRRFITFWRLRAGCLDTCSFHETWLPHSETGRWLLSEEHIVRDMRCANLLEILRCCL